MLNLMQSRVNANEPLLHRGRWVSLVFTFGLGDDDFLVDIERGRIVSFAPRGVSTRSGRFAIRADEAVWAEHWRPVPKRDYHDIWSMLPKSLVTIDGDLVPLIQNLQYFKDVISAPREEVPHGG